ncbi:hypothetical protein AN1V17_15720 [Vallitalea sediminicola]
MMKKVIVGIYVTVFIAAVIIGILNKQTYTNITNMDNAMDNFSVAVLNNELVLNTIDRMEEDLPNANIILKVKAEGEVENMFKLYKQRVIVEEVYNGDDIKKGDMIFIMAGHWRYYFDDMSANMGFTNLLEKDDEYLIFIKEKVNSLDINDDNIYCLVDTIINPVFNYEDKENVIVETSKDNYYVSYSEVSKNEFFVNSQDSLNKLEALKHRLIKDYDE